MVKHLKKVCKTIISMLIKFVGFDHIFPESEVFIMGNSLLKTERKKHFIVRPFPERDEELEDIFRTYDFELMVYFSNYITFHGTMEGEAEKLRKVLSYCKRSKEIHVIYLTGPEAGDVATTAAGLAAPDRYDRKDTSCPWSRESVLSVWENVPDSGQNRKNSVSVFRSL